MHCTMAFCKCFPIRLDLKITHSLRHNTIHMYSGITSGRVLNGELLYAICPVEWGEIFTKQSVGKCKQINF